jgi:ADP-ribose pyrophosphatase
MKEKGLDINYIYKGRIINLRQDSVELADGTKAKREIVEHKGAVAVLGKLPDGKFLFVRQYRRPFDVVMIEVPAGIPNPGEKGEDTARRELLEETGYLAKKITALGEAATSPGYSDEMIKFFAAEDLEFKGQDLDEDERVEAFSLSFEEAWKKILSGEIKDGKTMAILGLYEKKHR